MEAIALEHEDGVALRGGDPAPVRKLRVCESLVQHERRAARRVREVDDGGDDRVAHDAVVQEAFVHIEMELMSDVAAKRARVGPPLGTHERGVGRRSGSGEREQVRHQAIDGG